MRKNRGFIQTAGSVLKYVIAYSLALSALFPFVWMFLSSLKPGSRVFDNPLVINWGELSFEGYEYVLQRGVFGVTFWQLIANSTKVVFIIMIGMFFSCSMAAYAYAKIKFAGRDKIFLLKITSMMIPVQVTMIPLFYIYKKVGIYDTHMALWLSPFLGSVFGIFLLRQFFMTIPDELCEAAKIDGAGHPRIYWSLMLPLIKPALAALMVFTFVSSWNDYENPLIYIRSPEKFTLPLGLAVMLNDSDHLHYSGMMAGGVISVIPVLILFFSAQKYFIQGITLSGIKG